MALKVKSNKFLNFFFMKVCKYIHEVCNCSNYLPIWSNVVWKSERGRKKPIRLKNIHQVIDFRKFPKWPFVDDVCCMINRAQLCLNDYCNNHWKGFPGRFVKLEITTCKNYSYIKLKRHSYSTKRFFVEPSTMALWWDSWGTLVLWFYTCSSRTCKFIESVSCRWMHRFAVGHSAH